MDVYLKFEFGNLKFVPCYVIKSDLWDSKETI